MITLQLSVDCADPHRLCQFWSAVLDIPMVATDVDGLLAWGMATLDEIIEVDGQRVWSNAIELIDPNGQFPRLSFTRVPEAKAGKNRLHLDLYVGPDERPPLVERLILLGASVLYEANLGAYTWVTMADPEGNEFCVAERDIGG